MISSPHELSAISSNLVELLRRRALHQTDRRGYTFLPDGETEEANLTYGALDRRARAIGAMLQRTAAQGERVLLIYPPGLEYIAAFFGCLYAGCIAVPAYPPHPAHPGRSLSRLRTIANDARPSVALTTAALLPMMEALAAQERDIHALHWLATDTFADELAEEWHPPPLSSAMIAFLQYTSGSTATPKGVVLTHGNLLHNAHLIQHCFGHTPASRGVIWLPPYHDMGLIGGILQPLYVGFPVVLMAPATFLQQPLRWLQAISRYQATTSGGPNFAYDLCTRRIPPPQRAGLDLRSWRVAFNGAEPIRHETLEQFAAAFASSGFRREAFYPCYGLAEATLIVSGGSASARPIACAFQSAALEHGRVVPASEDGDADGRVLIGCGRSLPDQQIVIADPRLATRCQPGQVGEIWVAGPSISQGYWAQVAETQQTFHAYLADTAAGPFLRTGDLGFIQDGELFITGRLKDLIVIRGRNHYPQDIELTVERSHRALRPGCGAAFAIEIAEAERLVVVQEVERPPSHLDADAVATAIRQAVAAQHEVQVYAVALIKPGSIAKTSSGKIQRHACRTDFLDGKLELIGSSVLDDTALDWHDTDLISALHLRRDDLLAVAAEARPALLEAYLRAQIARLFHLALERVDSQQPLGALGLDSLMAIELQHAIETDLGLVLPMVRFLEDHSIAQLASDILTQVSLSPSELATERAPRQAPGTWSPLTIGQRALWFLHQLAPTSAAYTIANAVRLQGDLDCDVLRDVFQALIDRHPSLRTTFSQQAGEPIQEVHARATVAFAVQEAQTWSAASLDADLHAEVERPFDIKHGPLLRLRLYKRSAREHLLLLVIHHLVADLWSLAVLTQELGTLYAAAQAGVGAALAPLTHSYADYVAWQADMLAGPAGERLWAYWQRQLASAPSVLALPTDRSRPPVQTYRGGAHAFNLSPILTQRLKRLAQASKTTLYTTLLALFQVLMHRYSGQTDILIGCPTTGRSREELRHVIGYFVNPVVVRADLVSAPTFKMLLERARRTVLEALAHQEYPFALLVERLQPERDPSRSPLFQVMFLLQKAPFLDEAGLTPFALADPGARMHLGDLTVEAIALEQRAAQFDLTLMMAEVVGGMAGSWQYNADLFDQATIARMAAHFEILLTGIVAEPELRISELPLVSAVERQQLLLDWNATTTDYPQGQCLHQLFEAQVARIPDAIALLFDASMTNDDRADSSFRVPSGRRPSSSVCLTYAELNRRANELAQHLRALGVGPEVPVGVCMERSPELVVGLVGALKAGGAYLPLDPSYPQERLVYMLEDAGAHVLLTEQRLASRFPDQRAHVVYLDTGWEKSTRQQAGNPARQVTADNLAYIIYTSGSTGRPKGVLGSHSGAINRLHWMWRTYPFTPAERCCFKTSLSFVDSVCELFGPLLQGIPITIIPESVLKDPYQLIDTLAAAAVTRLVLVPSLLRVLLDLSGDLAKQLPWLKSWVTSGEALTPELAQRFYTRMPDRTLLNLYGSSEVAADAAWYDTRSGGTDLPTTPIGQPIANMQIYVMDAYLQPVPVGVVGELSIGGVGLARGYLNDPGLTAVKFIPHPFSQQPGARLYKSGDRARYLPVGTLEYLGRFDDQVKLRGFRVEPGEVETALLRHVAVREAVVVVREDIPGDKRLAAYVIPDQAQLPTTSELGHFLRAQLPDYMVPAAFVLLDALPLTPNGKVNRKALPALERLRPELETAYAIPRTAIERTIASIWQEALGVEKVGLHDNFFDLGGHSLLLVQVCDKLQKVLNRPIIIADMFRYPTISSLSSYLDGEEASQSNAQQIKDLAHKERTAIKRRRLLAKGRNDG
jgi:amino acid adenylation domain-containing protein